MGIMLNLLVNLFPFTELKANTLAYNQRIIEKSDIAETLIKSLALIENDLDVKLSVLTILQQLSKESGLCLYT